MVPEGWVALGTVIKPRGNQGEVAVHSLTSGWERFAELQQIWWCPALPTQQRELMIEKAWQHKDRIILKFAGIDSINEAKPLSRGDLCIPLAMRRKPAEGEVILSDFVGCSVLDEEGRILGVVQDWYENETLVWLVMQPGERLIPYAKEFFVEMRLAEKQLIVRLPEGLLDLNQS
jgi:16S rRNA processing protein RimM